MLKRLYQGKTIFFRPTLPQFRQKAIGRVENAQWIFNTNSSHLAYRDIKKGAQMVFFVVVFLRVYFIVFVKADIRQRLYFLPQLSHFCVRQTFLQRSLLYKPFFKAFHLYTVRMCIIFLISKLCITILSNRYNALIYIFSSKEFVIDSED